MEFLQRFFNSSDFMPHGHCYFWRPDVLWLHVISDGMIAVAYYSIPLALVYLVRKRTDLPFQWLFWLFGLFIVACGTTHVLAIVTVWDPIYRLDGAVKALTALTSMGTAAALIPIIPKALGLASPAQLLAANVLLEQEITARKAAEAHLAEANHEMEDRVRERTAELAQTIGRLRESEERLHAVLAAAPVILFATDSAGTFTFLEGKGLEAVGITSKERVGRAIREVHHDLPELLDCHRRALAGEAIELETQMADLTMDLRFSPTRQADGAITGVTGIGLDVTGARIARDHLLRAKEEAERANAAKSEFLSRMSHELRTPLNAVLGFAQLLEMRVASAEDATSITHILKAGRHLLALIDEVLDISRIETGRLELSIEPIAVQHITEETIRLLDPLARPRQIHFECAQVPADVYVMADRLRFQQCLLNLMSNAIKFNHERGVVRVTCERLDERVRVMVSDTGPGISDGDLTKLFIPFERLNANQRNIDGSGIGLALCKRLMESQGGKIGAESHVGEGSTFWIELPAAEPGTAAGSPVHERAVTPAVETPEGYTVLYIEDNVSNLTLVESIFQHYPKVHLIAAMQGGLGLEMAREHRPNLILLDLQLPDINGDEVLRRLQAEPGTRGIPVIILSADATVIQIKKLVAAGARAYLTKPLDVRKFLAVTDEFLHPPGPTPERHGTRVGGGDGKGPSHAAD